MDTVIPPDNLSPSTGETHSFPNLHPTAASIAQQCVLSHLQIESLEGLGCNELRTQLGMLSQDKMVALFNDMLNNPCVGLSKTGFCKRMNLNQGNFFRFMSGKKRSPASHHAIRDFNSTAD